MDSAEPRPGPSEESRGWDPRRIEKRLLELPSRKRVVDRIRARPGIHLRELARQVEMPLGTVEHHVHLLVRHGLVEAHRGTQRLCYFIAREVRGPERPLLATIRLEPFRRILHTLLREPDIGFSALAVQIGATPGTLSYHLQRLIRQGIVEDLRVGRSRLYRILDPDGVARALERWNRDETGGLEPHLSQESTPFGADSVMRHLLDRVPPDDPSPNQPVLQRRPVRV